MPAFLASAQQIQQKLPAKTRILFLLDGSGSMLSEWENTNRMIAAKKLLSDLVDSLKVNPDLELALRVYGHLYDRRYQNCEDSKLEVPFSKDNHTSIQQKLLQIKPQGTTPIAYSLQQAAGDFPPGDQYRNIIIIITDGIESCNGDPCAVSLQLQQKGIFLKPFIIGIGMNKTYEEQFRCVGRFFDADNISGFKTALKTAIRQSLEKATVSVELLDAEERPRETNVNITFINNFTGEPAYEFVHYRDRYGKPDSVQIDPVLTYDIVVNTVPPVIRNNVTVEGGKHNVIRITAPQAQLKVTQESHTEYKNGVRVLIRKAGENEIIHSVLVPQAARLLLGTYDLEILTTPKISMPGVQLQQGQPREIKLPGPGILNILSSFPGYGSIYQLLPEGQKWVANLDENESSTTMALQPGKYKFVFRSRNSMGSKYTQIRDFEMRSGATVNIKLNY